MIGEFGDMLRRDDDLLVGRSDWFIDFVNEEDSGKSTASTTKQKQNPSDAKEDKQTALTKATAFSRASLVVLFTHRLNAVSINVVGSNTSFRIIGRDKYVVASVAAEFPTGKSFADGERLSTMWTLHGQHGAVLGDLQSIAGLAGRRLRRIIP